MKNNLQEGIDYIGVGAGAVIINDDNKIFLSLRGKKAKNERGTWEFPGGSIKFGETLEQGLQREVKEEFGIDIKIRELLDVCDHILPNEKQHWVAPTFLCTITKGTPHILEPEKCDEIGWFNLSQISTLPLSMVTEFTLKTLQKRKSPTL